MASRPLSVATIVAVSAAASLLAAPALAFTPTKTSNITVSVDGTTLGIDSSVSDLTGSRSGVFGGAMTPGSGSVPGSGELTEMYAAKDNAFVNFTAQGGIVAVSGGSCSATTYYRRAQVTVDNLPGGTNDVWVLYDPSVGPNIGAPTPQFNDTGTMISVSGSSGSTTLTLTSPSSTSGIAVGDQINGSGIAAGTTVAAVVDSTTLTLSANLTGTASGNAIVFRERIGPTSGLEKLCDGTTAYVAGASGTSASPATLALGDTSATPMSTGRVTAGLQVNDTTASSVSFDIYVPTDGEHSGSTENFIALGIVVDAGGNGTLDDATDDTAIFTHVVSSPWTGSMADNLLLAACSSPAAGDAPCYESSATGLFQSDGTTSLGTFSVTSTQLGGSGESMAQVAITPTTAQAGGFAIPAGSIAKMSISWPTTGITGGINFGIADFSLAAADTTLKVNPATTSSSSSTNRWDFATPTGRVVTTIIGEARATSSAVSRSSWYSNCEVSISGDSVSTTGCGEGMTSSVSSTYMVFTTVPASIGLAVTSDPVMQTVAGGLVSTNAQGVAFGAETMAGQSFQFAVAGPSYDASDASRASDGFYYVCVPAAFISGSFGTTAADAVSTWEGTRDGAVVSTSFSAGSCALGDAGLVASLDPFGYSAPLFRVKPPTAPSSGGSSGSAGTPAATTTVATTSTAASTTTAPSQPAAVPVLTPQLPTAAVGRALKSAYLVRLAKLSGLKAPKGSSVRISVPRMYRSVCAVKDGKVVAKAPGLCGVKVKATGLWSGKVRAKRVYLQVS